MKMGKTKTLNLLKCRAIYKTNHGIREKAVSGGVPSSHEGGQRVKNSFAARPGICPKELGPASLPKRGVIEDVLHDDAVGGWHEGDQEVAQHDVVDLAGVGGEDASRELGVHAGAREVPPGVDDRGDAVLGDADEGEDLGEVPVHLEDILVEGAVGVELVLREVPGGGVDVGGEAGGVRVDAGVEQVLLAVHVPVGGHADAVRVDHEVEETFARQEHLG